MIQKVLVGADTTAAADLAVDAAAEMAKAHDAELLVLYVKPPGDARGVVDPDKAPDPDRYLQRVRERFPDVKTRTRLEPGEPAMTLCDVAEEEDSDMIVVGNRGTHEKRRRYLRSVPNGVVQHAPCAVYIVDTRRAQ